MSDHSKVYSSRKSKLVLLSLVIAPLIFIGVLSLIFSGRTEIRSSINNACTIDPSIVMNELHPLRVTFIQVLK